MLLIISAITFAIFFVLPRLAGQTPDNLAAQYVARDPSPQAIHAVKVKLGFDQPIVVQYGRFLKGLVAGAHYDYGPDRTYCPPPCFGYSYKNQQPVWPMLMNRLPVSASLAAGAAAIWLVFGVAVGVVSALRQGSLIDRLAMMVALAGVSMPIFFTGSLSLVLFSDGLGILQVVHYVPVTENPLLWARNLLLPWITLAFLYLALYARLTRAMMLETMEQDYITTARAKGLPERAVVTRHALRAVLPPILTIFGLDFGLLLGGAVVTETIYSLPGVGRLTVEAVQNQDLPILLGVTVLGGIFIVVANLFVDLLYAVVDPTVHRQA